MTPKDNNPNAPAPEEDYSLEEILAEYGGSLEHHLLRDAEAPAKPPAPPEEPAPAKEPEAPPVPEPPAEEAPPEPPRRRSPLPPRTPSRRPRGRRRRTWPG